MMACSGAINGGATPRLNVLGNIWRDIADVLIGHELPSVVPLVGTQGFLVVHGANKAIRKKASL